MTRDDLYAMEYRLRLEYLQSHFSRMLTRFSFLLTINSALLGFSLDKDYEKSAVMLIVIGITLSVLWFYYGGVDDYMAKAYREQVKKIHDKLKDAATELASAERNSLYAAGDPKAAENITPSFPELKPREGRLIRFGPTSFVAVFPLLFIILWLLRGCLSVVDL